MPSSYSPNHPSGNLGTVRAAWAEHAEALALWAWQHLVNRVDVWGGYRPLHERGRIYRRRNGTIGRLDKTTTRPALSRRGQEFLTEDILACHFAARAPEQVAGLHTTGPENTSRWGAVDVDWHGLQSTAPEINWAAALDWFEKLRSLGFQPLLTDSNGAGGYHLLLPFSEPLPTPKVFAFCRWLVSDHARHGLPRAPEIFPKQPALAAGECGNWLRLPGRHHTREHWSRVWDGSRWLDGVDACKFILALQPSPPGLIPTQVREHEPPTVRVIVRFVPPHPPRRGSLEARIRASLAKLPNLALGQGRDDVAYRFACFLIRDLGLSDEAAVPWLAEWDQSNDPPKGSDALREIIGNARRYGRHAVGCGLI
jgi:putative DNA primase/helicase